MLFYTHLVWGKDLMAFLGPHAWIDRETARGAECAAAWSPLYYIDSPALLWLIHIAALILFALLTVGLFTRVISVLAAIFTLAYCHRLVGTQFGLDQVNAMLALISRWDRAERYGRSIASWHIAAPAASCRWF